MAKSIKRFISLLLTVMLITGLFTFQAFATSLGGNTQSGGGTSVGSDAVLAHKTFMYPENMGYRISIVDKSGYRVANSIDIVNYDLRDINNIGYDNSNNGYGRQEFVDGYNEYKSWLGFQDYSNVGWSKENRVFYSNGIKTEPYSEITWNLSGVPTSTNLDGEYIETNVYPKVKIEEYLLFAYNNKVAKLKAENSTKYASLTTLDSVEIPLPSILNESKTAFTPGGVELIELMQNFVGGVDVGESLNVLTEIVNMPMTIYDWQCNNTGTVDYLFRFSDPTEQARVVNKEINPETGKAITTAEIIIEQGYKVVIEPLYWYVPYICCIHPDILAYGLENHIYGWIPAVCYGTVSYIQKYVYEAFTSYLTEEQLQYSWSGPDWGPALLGCTTLMLDHTDEDLGIYEPSKSPIKLEKVMIGTGTPGYSIYSLAAGDNSHECGYAVHIYDNLLRNTDGDGTSTSTYDELTYGPDTPSGYSPGPSEDKSTDGGYTLKNNIVKFYANKYSDTSYDYLENHTRTDTVSKISLENEPGYTIDSWFSSSEFKQPTSPTDSYSDVKSSLPNKQSGGADANKTVTLDAKDTLYVRLIKSPLVIKIYESNGTVDKIVTEQNPTINNNQYDVKDPDGDYEYTESLISNKPSVNPDTWNDCIGEPSESDPISISPDTVVIYIHYAKESPLTDSGLVLHENEISHNFSLSDITGELMSCTRHYKYVSVPECGYFYDCGCSSDDDDCDCWSCDASMNEDDAGTYSFDVVNRPSYNVQFVYKWTQSNTHYSGDGEGHSGFEVEAQPDMKFTLSRAYADKPTLYPGLNSGSAKTALTEMGITSEGYKPAGTRYGNKSEQSRRLNWTTTFTTHWTYENIKNPTIEFDHDGHDEKSKSQSSYDGSYTETYNSSSVYSIGQIKTYSSYYKVWDGSSWVYFRKSTYGSKSKAYTAAKEFAQELTTNSSSSATGGISSLNSSYSQSNNTTIYGLWGKPNTGTTAPTDKVASNKWTLNNMTFTSRRSTIESTANITFYPYYKMVYQTLNTSDKDVYLTSENISTLLNLQRVDTAIYKTNAKPSLYLQSYQWSVHARIQNNLSSYNILDKDSFLPAGAIYSLATGQDNNANDVYVGFRIFSTYVSDKAALANSDSSILNKSEAQTKINNFITQSKNILDNYEITMNGATGIYVDSDNFFDKATQLTGQYGTYKIANQKFDSDSKYDLQSNGSGASRADIDILDEKSQQYIWTLKADAEGNITVYKDGSLLETIKKSSTSISNSSVKEFNERTNLVTNFINALDRNLGSDRSGKAWYNEGFEINCIEHQQAFKLGFGGTDTLRSAALNIKANGYLSDRSDMYNLDQDTINEKARTYKFYTSQKSTVSEASSHSVGWVGNFGNTEVIIPGIHEMFTSKLFYTSNTTVQDLN